MSSSDAAKAAKAEARAAAKLARASAHAMFDGLGGGLFIQPFIRAISVAPTATIAAYVAIGDEADPAPLLEVLGQHGCTIALPRIVAPEQPLSFIRWASGDALEPGPFGTWEPTGHDVLVPDIVIVPLLAFSPEGHRLGYGGGYYDRSLALLRQEKPEILAIGLAYGAQEVTNLPVETEDQPLDWIVTERGARSFAGQI